MKLDLIGLENRTVVTRECEQQWGEKIERLINGYGVGKTRKANSGINHTIVCLLTVLFYSFQY